MTKKKKTEKPEWGLARRRAETIMKVRCGLMTAADAARSMGISRKTYYKWEQRGLAALLDGLQDQVPGRPEPPAVDQEKADLERKIAGLEKEKELFQQKIKLKELKHQIELQNRRSKKTTK